MSNDTNFGSRRLGVVGAAALIATLASAGASGVAASGDLVAVRTDGQRGDQPASRRGPGA